MQGNDKGLLKAHGKMLIEYTLDKLRPQVDYIFISANRNLDDYKNFNYPVYTDTRSDYAGPLAGILTALENIHEEALLFVAPCDMPELPANLLNRLVDHLLSQEAEICCVNTQNRLQPLLAVMHTGVHANLRTYLESGNKKVQDWVKQLALTTVDYSDQETAFMNINTPDELEQYERQDNE